MVKSARRLTARPLSTLLSLSDAVKATSSEQKHASTWSNTIQSAIFPNSTEPHRTPTPSTSTLTASSDAYASAASDLPPTVVKLLDLLRHKHPDPHLLLKALRIVDQAGDMHRLQPKVLHHLLAAVHIEPRQKALSVQDAILRAKQYEVRAEGIRDKIKLAGGATSMGDLTAMARQYHALGYAPGACAVWDEWVQKYGPPPSSLIRYTLASFSRWIRLHRSFGGDKIGKVTAEALVERSIAMLDSMQKTDMPQKRIQASLHDLFFVLRRSQNEPVFSEAFRYIYAFDYTLPGADLGQAPHRLSQPITHYEVNWLLEVLGQANKLSSMIAVFEVFDSPSPMPNLHHSTYFAPSFHPPRPIISTAADRPAGLVGTKAHIGLIRTAARLGKGGIAKHYYKQLSERWELWTDKWISEMEQIMGINQDAEQSAALEEAYRNYSAKSSSADPSSSKPQAAYLNTILAEPDKTHTPSPTPLPTHTASTIRHQRLVNIPPPPLGHPYVHPSELIYRVTRGAKRNYDLVLGRRMRRAAAYTLKLMFKQIKRLEAILDKYRETPNELLTPQLPVIERELLMIRFHEEQLKLTFWRIKNESNVIKQRTELRRVVFSYNALRRDLESVKGTLAETKRLPTLKRYENRMLRHRLAFCKDRIVRMKALGTEFEHPEYTIRHAVTEMQELRNKLTHKVTGSWKRRSEKEVADADVEPHTVEQQQR